MSAKHPKPPATPDEKASSGHDTPTGTSDKQKPPREVGGRKGPEPTRFGDWEKAGRCIDF